jgi:hypothetical protein
MEDGDLRGYKNIVSISMKRLGFVFVLWCPPFFFTGSEVFGIGLRVVLRDRLGQCLVGLKRE